MTREAKRGEEQLIPVQFGQFFTPFSEIDIQKVVEEGTSPESHQFKLEKTGTINIDLEKAMQVGDSGEQTLTISRDISGNPILKEISPELYELQVSVTYDNPETVNPHITCTLKIGTLNVTSINTERDNPVQAGYAVYINWGGAPEDQFVNLLIPTEYIKTFQLKFDNAVSALE